MVFSSSSAFQSTVKKKHIHEVFLQITQKTKTKALLDPNRIIKMNPNPEFTFGDLFKEISHSMERALIALEGLSSQLDIKAAGVLEYDYQKDEYVLKDKADTGTLLLPLTK